MWIDTDDVIQNAENIPLIADKMEDTNNPLVMFTYDYAPRINGKSPVTQQRERLIDLVGLL
jgi:hypothetical protein